MEVQNFSGNGEIKVGGEKWYFFVLEETKVRFLLSLAVSFVYLQVKFFQFTSRGEGGGASRTQHHDYCFNNNN